MISKKRSRNTFLPSGKVPVKRKQKRHDVTLLFKPPNSNIALAVPMNNYGPRAEWRTYLVNAKKKISQKPIRVNTTLFEKKPVITIPNPTRMRVVNAILKTVKTEPNTGLVLHSIRYDPQRGLYTVGFNS